MPSFGRKSRALLDTCDPRIVEIFEEVVKHVDCSVLEGRRDKETQDEYFRTGRSKLKWPNSKHNVLDPSDLSKAIDIVPYPIDWNDWNRFYHFVGFAQAIAKSKGYTLRSGLDWDQDFDFSDQNFNDAPHFEIVD
jgi:peptidoglycan L-alanyl-D-glutamate endopeptidase CwlK